MAAITKKQVEPISKGLATMQKQLGDMLKQLHNGQPADSNKLDQASRTNDLRDMLDDCLVDANRLMEVCQ